MSPRRDGADLYFPSLLDRLREDERRVADWPQFKALVLRDLARLLNARRLIGSLDDPGEGGEHLDEVRGSVVNFGLPDTTGRTLTPAHIEQLVKSVEEAIRKYEPRIRLDRSRPVRATERGEHGRLCLEIRGELKSEPAPEWLCIETQLDIETGDCDVVETSGDPDE